MGLKQIIAGFGLLATFGCSDYSLETLPSTEADVTQQDTKGEINFSSGDVFSTKDISNTFVEVNQSDSKEDISSTDEDTYSKNDFFNDNQDTSTNKCCPIITSTPNAMIKEGDKFTYSLMAIDCDADILSFKMISGPPGSTLDNTGVISFTSDCNSAGNYKFDISVSDGTCVTMQSFTLTVAEACGDCNNGDKKEVKCETKTPCLGTKVQECFNGIWKDNTKCLDTKVVAKGIAPSVDGDNLAYIDDNKKPIEVISMDLISGKKKILTTFSDWGTQYPILKVDGGRILFSQLFNPDGKATVFDLNTGITYTFKGKELFCTDVSGDVIACAESFLKSYTINLKNNAKTDIPKGNCSYPLIEGDIVVLPKFNCKGTIQVYDLGKKQNILKVPIKGVQPVLSQDRLIYAQSSIGQKIDGDMYLLDLNSGLTENISKSLGGFRCNSLLRIYASFDNQTLICNAVHKGIPGLYVVNLKTKKFQLLDKSFGTQGLVSSQNGLVAFNTDDDAYDKLDLHICQLKNEWGEFYAK